jgi:hypothetical protein
MEIGVFGHDRVVVLYREFPDRVVGGGLELEIAHMGARPGVRGQFSRQARCKILIQQ